MTFSDALPCRPGERAWQALLRALPDLQGKTVLDLGCGTGEPAAAIAARGARVIGVDAQEDFLREARARGIAGAEFVAADLRSLPELGVAADGLWCCYSVAYFVELVPVLVSWARHLRPGGWIAITEIDDLLGQEPLNVSTVSLLDAYARDALAAKRYDFHMGRKLRGHLEEAGFRVDLSGVLEDPEFAFLGAAGAAALDSWRRRLDRMPVLRDFCGAEFEGLRRDFLACLAREDHRSRAKVVGCIARR